MHSITALYKLWRVPAHRQEAARYPESILDRGQYHIGAAGRGEAHAAVDAQKSTQQTQKRRRSRIR